MVNGNEKEKGKEIHENENPLIPQVEAMLGNFLIIARIVSPFWPVARRHGSLASSRKCSQS
jgi:hypothetical protein